MRDHTKLKAFELADEVVLQLIDFSLTDLNYKDIMWIY